MAGPKNKLGALGALGKRLLANPDEARLNELLSHSGDKALPLKLPRANLSDEFIDQQADRVARQMLGEHVTSGKAGDTKNLAGRSMKESQRVKNLNYKLTPTGTVAKETPYTPRKGDVKVAFPGDQTVSDKILDEVEGFPIDSQQQGGAYYGLGQKHLKDPEFWKSTETPAKNVQAKVDRVAELYEPERVIGSHLAMGPMSNNFAMHLADANLRAIDWSKAQPSKINQFDRLIAKGYFDPVAKKKVTFPDWPGLADREAALAAMKENTALRKWVNNRFKTPAVTEPLGLPNGLDIQYAITEPRIRDMEINMTGLMTGELKPNALVEAAGAPHNTYSHRILGEALGPQEVLTPFVLDFPDAAQHIASTKRPSDFTGTIQKVFPHQVVDDQYINQYNQYRERIKKLTGQKKGGAVNGGADLMNYFDKRIAGMAKGGEVGGNDELTEYFDKRMAGGGKVKGAAKVFKKLFADDVLPAPQREVNLKKFIAPSAEKRRMYHGSKEPNIKEFKTRKEMTDESMMTGHYADERDAVFLSPEPDFTKNFSQMGYTDTHQAPTTYPVYVQVEKPFDFDNPEHLKLVKETYKDMFHNPDSDFYERHISPSERSMTLHTFNKRVDSLPSDENNWARIENQDFQDVLKDLGFDSFYTRERGTKNLGVYEPNRIKSAIGNRGTYDLGESDINKASGGLAHMGKGGKMSALGKLGKRLLADPDAVTPSVSGGTRKFGDDAGGLNIVKETGGNWLGGVGSPERALQPLRQKLNSPESLANINSYDPAQNLARIEKTWTPELIEKQSKIFPRLPIAVEEAKARLKPQAALNNWVDSNLTNYVKKQMGTANDPVRKLAEEGIIHIPTNQVGLNRYKAGEKRQKLGTPQLGQSDAAKAWEDSTDVLIDVAPASKYVEPLTEKEIRQGYSSLVDDNPYLAKVDPNTPIHASESAVGTDLGFDHIMDVLKMDLEAGRLRPEQLNKVSMEQAVRRTYEYDQEMAKRMRETQIKATEGMPTYKEYPEQGFKWIELSHPKDLPKGWSQDAAGVYLGPNGERTIINPSRQNLEDALKYEGDTMGHCVGNYCEDVAQGRSRIYSLRDAKGEPHVTIEVQPDQNILGFKNAKENYPELYAKYSADKNKYSNSWRDFLRQEAPEVLENVPKQITQIKGKQNAAPKEDYLPFVQDFVKSGNWSEVGDLKNTGLIRRDNKYLTPSEDADWLLKELGLKPDDGMAEGGGAFKKIRFMDKGGITTTAGSFSPEDLGVSVSELPPDVTFADVAKYAKRIGKNAADLAVQGKESLSETYERVKDSPRARAQLAKVLALQTVGGVNDFAHMFVDPFAEHVLDPLKSKTIDKVFTKPKYRSVLAPKLKKGEKEEREPIFGSISNALATEDGYPIGGSDHMIKRAQQAGLMFGRDYPLLNEDGSYAIDPETNQPYQSRSGRFNLLTEIGGGLLGGLGLSKLGKVAKKGYVKNIEPRVDPAGALTRAINLDYPDADFNQNYLRAR